LHFRSTANDVEMHDSSVIAYDNLLNGKNKVEMPQAGYSNLPGYRRSSSHLFHNVLPETCREVPSCSDAILTVPINLHIGKITIPTEFFRKMPKFSNHIRHKRASNLAPSTLNVCSAPVGDRGICREGEQILILYVAKTSCEYFKWIAAFHSGALTMPR
jgi:hypothetical protein